MLYEWYYPIWGGARLRLLGDIVFNAGYYKWQAILKFHAAILSEIENGNMQWGDC